MPIAAAPSSTVIALSGADEIAADEYLKWHPIQSEAAKKSDGAKKRLLASLGSYIVGRLPGGRLVQKFSTPVAAEANPRAGLHADIDHDRVMPQERPKSARLAERQPLNFSGDEWAMSRVGVSVSASAP